MNKCLIIIVLGVVSVALTEPALTSDRQKLYKALKQKFKELKVKKTTTSDHPHKTTKTFQQHEEEPALAKKKATPQQHQHEKTSQQHEEEPTLAKKKVAPQQHQHEKAANAFGLALLEEKPKNAKVNLISDKSKDTKKIIELDDDFPDDDQDKLDDDEETNSAVVSKENKHRKFTDEETKESKGKKIKMGRGKWNRKKHQEDDRSKQDISEKEEKSIKNSDKSLKNSVKFLKDSVKNLRDKDLQTVNVGELKHLLATSVENLGKAEEAIHDLLQYDAEKKSKNKNNKPAAPGYPQAPQPPSGYPQIPPSPAYQNTCPGQCSSQCAPSCRDPCCSSPPNVYNNMGTPPVQARGSYQQGLVNSYPPLTTLGVNQGDMSQFQQQGLGQQCGSQCSPQSCAPSCNPSCCAFGAQAPPAGMSQGPIVSRCKISCFRECEMGCPRRCCVPGRK